MSAAVANGNISRTPCVGVKLPRAPKEEQQILSEDQVATLANSCRSYDALVYVLAYSGLRWGEVAALRCRRVDVLRSRVEVTESLADVDGHLHFGPTKGYARRWVKLPRWVSEMLEPLLEGKGPGRPAIHGASRRTAPLHQLPQACVAEGCRQQHSRRLTPHHLRHTCASLLIARGASVKAVQVQLGHSSPAITLNLR
jgi:integrase